jgi:hypothetical protein
MPALAVTPQLSSLPPAQRDARIIALCDQAIGQLREARDVEEVFGIRNAAEAFATYTRKYRAAVDAQAQCQLVVFLAEARIGAELEKAQARGEVATQERKSSTVRIADGAPTSHSDLGIPRQRAAEMKALARKGEPAIRAHIKTAADTGRVASRRSILAAIPTLNERPPECTQFILWLRTGAQLVSRLGDPALLPDTLVRHRMSPEPGQVQTILSFLSRMEPQA